MLQRLTWPAVALAAVCIAAVTVLGVLHLDTSVVMVVITSVLTLVGSAMGGQLAEIKTQVNGNLSEALAQNRRSMEMLAAAQPIQHPLPDTTVQL